MFTSPPPTERTVARVHLPVYRVGVNVAILREGRIGSGPLSAAL